MGLEAVRPFPFPNAPSLLPSVEAGIRNDGGDAETGFGLDIGAALAWDDPHHGISAELRGRSLVTHVAEASANRAWSLLRLAPSPTNRGPSLSLHHAVGSAPAGGMDALLPPAVMEQLNGS
ncbi:MAG: hypothetical protein OXC96_07275, partial [Cyanobacteria bacterium MAG CAR1_bin_15]|nr:hypothetical protein [Cyanobacteria bacterium MAG CAR1_bin_15]